MHFPVLWEREYGDSYILHDILRYRDTGIIYHDFSVAPHVPVLYSPMLYVAYSFGSRIAPESIFFGPRLVAFAAFLLCVVAAVSLVKALIPTRWAWLWGAIIATSIRCTAAWPLQLRGDFMAIFFGLTSIRLLMIGSQSMVAAAGFCAGFALTFKVTYVSALGAGALWLLIQKRWKDLLLFISVALVACAGVYLFFWTREPRMFSQLLSLTPGIRDLTGDIKLIQEALQQSVVLLALAAVPVALSRAWPRWQLLLLFASISFVISAAANLQAGGNVNYFFEMLFALTPFAVLGLFRLMTWSRRVPQLALFLVAALLIHQLRPIVVDAFNVRQIRPSTVASFNASFLNLEAALKGHRIFSKTPRLALIDPHPILTEPYLYSYLRRLGKVDTTPLLQRIRDAEFDVFIDERTTGEYRGVARLEGADFAQALASSYAPYCVVPSNAVMPAVVIHLPRARPRDEEFAKKLRASGCKPTP